MAAGFRQLNLESPQSDTYPLLMDGNSLPNHEHVLTIPPRMSEGLDERAGLPSSTQSDTAISLGSTSAVSQPQITPLAGSLGRSGSLRWRRNANNYGAHQRASPLNSGLWISIELTVTMSQVIASIIVLSLSRDEKPKAPLSVWVVGYATGCLATVPLLYWRYTYHFAHQSNQNALDSGQSRSIPPRSSQTSFALPQRTVSQSEEADGIASTPGQNRISVVGDSRNAVYMERFKIALDCYFAVWFVVGNVWIFGGHSSSHEAPNLYRLCVVFLTFSCIGYAMPFIICVTICCCLPCIITLLGFQEGQGQAKGAAPEVIEQLPIYKFSTKVLHAIKQGKDGNESDCESPGAGGVFAAGTDKERAVSAEDAVCCICLAMYKDDVDLRELPCTHFFHVDCVDKWLKINASCPLCKQDISGPGEQTEQLASDGGD